MQNRMDEFESAITRYISVKISRLQPRDFDYAKTYYIKQINKKIRCMPDIYQIKQLYKSYLLGEDIFQILDKQEFYSRLSPTQFPELFSIAPSKPVKKVSKAKVNIKDEEFWTSFELPPEATFIKDNIPKVKKTIIWITKRYITLMEHKSWIERYGLTMPQLKENKQINLPGDKASWDLKLLETIEDVLKNYKTGNKKIIDDENYKNLIIILYNYFKYGKVTTLKEPIAIKKGSMLKIASDLGIIYKKLRVKDGITYEYLMLGKKNISLFSKCNIEQAKFTSSNLYKYYNG
jgi:hypothetical protein